MRAITVFREVLETEIHIKASNKGWSKSKTKKWEKVSKKQRPWSGRFKTGRKIMIKMWNTADW